MEAKLGIKTCDRCGQPMKKQDSILIIAEGIITCENELLTFTGSCIRYACHLDCWDGVEEAYKEFIK